MEIVKKSLKIAKKCPKQPLFVENSVDFVEKRACLGDVEKFGFVETRPKKSFF